MKNELERNLTLLLEQCLPAHSFAEVYRYAVLPAGKLFRPKLALAAYADAGGDTHDMPSGHNLWLLATALEIHHAYTLVHDDLPAMDDDDERRGRPSTHKAFGQWQAILAGDGLSIASFRLLSRVNHPQLSRLMAIASHALGPKGLIQGQALDLSGEMTESFEKLLLTHELKTARLIQLSLVGGHLLAQKNSKARELKKLWRLGHAVGVAFQLLDDLSELDQPLLSNHEAKVNPWLTREKECLEKTLSLLNIIEHESGKSVRHELSLYFKKMHSLIMAGQDSVLQHLGNDRALLPVMALLQRLSQ